MWTILNEKVAIENCGLSKISSIHCMRIEKLQGYVRIFPLFISNLLLLHVCNWHWPLFSQQKILFHNNESVKHIVIPATTCKTTLQFLGLTWKILGEVSIYQTAPRAKNKQQLIFGSLEFDLYIILSHLILSFLAKLRVPHF